MDDLAEESYWRFDARRKGYGPWKETPQSERDAYKAELAALRAQLAARDAEAGRLRDFVSDYSEEPCEYGDGCTNVAIHINRHYRCLPCKARAALKGEG